MNKEKFLNKVTVIWGTDRDFKRSYFFETPKELDAFMLGLEECLGWEEYHIEEVDYEYKK